ncbi:hypothetical protein SAY87_023396 [Trapa incisa]|uniref:Uncharacterized protein n=1 Tax=Trapa incisa TaxID=236973 RepID=A0AAN7L5J4_9MYRT|nr:hypothetical protein SAY87_023396 [Trapa incisa]
MKFFEGMDDDGTTNDCEVEQDPGPMRQTELSTEQKLEKETGFRQQDPWVGAGMQDLS